MTAKFQPASLQTFVGSPQVVEKRLSVSSAAAAISDLSRSARLPFGTWANNTRAGSDQMAQLRTGPWEVRPVAHLWQKKAGIGRGIGGEQCESPRAQGCTTTGRTAGCPPMAGGKMRVRAVLAADLDYHGEAATGSSDVGFRYRQHLRRRKKRLGRVLSAVRLSDYSRSCQQGGGGGGGGRCIMDCGLGRGKKSRIDCSRTVGRQRDSFSRWSVVGRDGWNVIGDGWNVIGSSRRLVKAGGALVEGKGGESGFRMMRRRVVIAAASEEGVLGTPGASDGSDGKQEEKDEVESTDDAGLIEKNDGADDEESRSRDALAVLLEIDGVLADVHEMGHRQAFNEAFSLLGLECATWPDKVYGDLVLRCGGDESLMVRTFFDRIGWPMSVATKDKEIFVKKVLMLKQSRFEELAAKGSIPLRPGVEDFIDDATAAGVPMAIIKAGNRSGDTVAASLMEKLGEDRLSNVIVVGEEEVARSTYNQVAISSGGISSASENAIADYAQRAVLAEKQRVASEIAAILSVSVGIELGGSVVASGGKEETEEGEGGGEGEGRERGGMVGGAAALKALQGRRVSALLAAVELIGVPRENCVLLAGSKSGLEAGLTAGIPPVIVKTRLTARGEFPQALASFDSFGFGDGVKLPQLRALLRTWRASL